MANLFYGDDGKCINTKIKTYDDSVITNFHNKKMPQENTTCICLSIIMLDSVIKASIILKQFWKNANKNKDENGKSY